MGELGGFLEVRARARRRSATRPSASATTASSSRTLPLVELREQGARCMECGVPFCHTAARSAT